MVHVKLSYNTKIVSWNIKMMQYQDSQKMTLILRQKRLKALTGPNRYFDT